MEDARFTRRARLSKKAEFQNVFDRPIKSVDSYFAVLAKPNPLGYPRLGLAISRKTAKSAVARNRIKRLVRESFRCHQRAFGSVDIVVIGRGDLSRQDNAVIFNSLKRHWTRLARQWAKF